MHKFPHQLVVVDHAVPVSEGVHHGELPGPQHAAHRGQEPPERGGGHEAGGGRVQGEAEHLHQLQLPQPPLAGSILVSGTVIDSGEASRPRHSGSCVTEILRRWWCCCLRRQ